MAWHGVEFSDVVCLSRDWMEYMIPYLLCRHVGWLVHL